MSGEEMLKVSVVIPVYNREKVIERSIRSILEQTRQAAEILVVDDGSEDGTEAAVRKVKDDRIRYIRLSHNSGASGARNRGAEEAKGELVAFQDSDDCWRPEKLEMQLKYWEQHPEISMLCSAYLYHMVDGRAIKVPADTLRGKLEGDIFSSLLLRNSVGTPTVLVRRDCFLQSGGFDTALRSLEDWEFAIRFSREYLIGYVPEILVDAFETQGGVSSNAGAYYESRCRIIGRYRQELTELGLFDQAVGDVFGRADRSGVLPVVQRLLMACLQEES